MVSRSFSEPASPAGSISFSDLVAGMGGEIEALVHRLPAGVDVIERIIADGADMEELDLMLGSLPDADELDRLTAALDDPGKLTALLATREAGVVAHTAGLEQNRSH